MTREMLTRSLGATLQLVCVILLIGLIPFSVYASTLLYRAAVAAPAAQAGTLVHAAARVVACAILAYALWQLRKTGARLAGSGVPWKR